METKPLFARFSGHRSPVYALAEGREGLFYTADADGWLVEWNLHLPEEGRLIARMPGSVYAICLFPEQQLLVAAVNRDGFHFIDFREGKEVFSIPSGSNSWYRMKTIPGGKIIAGGSAGKLALLETNERSVRFFEAGTTDLRGMDLFPSSGELLLGNSNAEVLHLNSAFDLVSTLPAAHEKTVFSLCTFPDEKAFVSAGRDARLNLFHLNGEGRWEKMQSVAAHMAGIHDVCIHPEQKILATASMDKTIKIWDADSLRLLRVLDMSRHGGHSHSVNQLCWLAESELLLSCSDDRSILAWNIYH